MDMLKSSDPFVLGGFANKADSNLLIRWAVGRRLSVGLSLLSIDNCDVAFVGLLNVQRNCTVSCKVLIDIEIVHNSKLVLAIRSLLITGLSKSGLY